MSTPAAIKHRKPHRLSRSLFAAVGMDNPADDAIVPVPVRQTAKQTRQREAATVELWEAVTRLVGGLDGQDDMAMLALSLAHEVVLECATVKQVRAMTEFIEAVARLKNKGMKK